MQQIINNTCSDASMIYLIFSFTTSPIPHCKPEKNVPKHEKGNCFSSALVFVYFFLHYSLLFLFTHCDSYTLTIDYSCSSES